MKYLSLALAIFLISVAVSEDVSGQTVAAGTVSGTATATQSNVMQAQFVESTVSVDGVLDEAAWQQATPITGFQQFNPTEGEPATQRTEVRVLYGPTALYIGANLYDTNPEAIAQNLGRRDVVNQADWFIAHIDGYFDKKTALLFGVNAAGVQVDATRTGNMQGGGGGGGGGPGGGGGNPGGGANLMGWDTSWDAIWTATPRITSEGWTVEMRIPYSMLRFSSADVQTWGIQFQRRIARSGEQVEWPLVPRTQRPNLVALFGELQGIRGIEPRTSLQVSPYTVTRMQTSEDPQAQDELFRQSQIDVGGDLKVGLGSSATLNVTINPDFGQVEADPAQLNLTAFETFNQERRPFFVEGIQNYQFQMGPGNMLYTRRIGAGERIIGAAKLSGQTASGLSFGVLGATTGDFDLMTLNIDESLEGSPDNFNPNRFFGVTRLSQQIQSFSSVGGMVTAFDGPEDEGRLRAFAGGVDWDARLFDNAYSLSGFGALTHRSWTEDGIDAEAGFAGMLNWRKLEGVWTYRISSDYYSPLFNPNDVGRLPGKNDDLTIFTSAEYEINGGRPFGPFRNGSAELEFRPSWALEGGYALGTEIGLGTMLNTRGFERLMLNFDVTNPFGGYDPFETRGLWPRANPTEFSFNGNFNTDSRRSLRFGPRAGGSLFDDGGRELNVGLNTNWDVSSRVSLSAQVGGEWENDVFAWASNEAFVQDQGVWGIRTDADRPSSDDPLSEYDFDNYDLSELDIILAGVDPFDEAGHYYVPVYGTRDTRSVDFTLRTNVTFTRTLSLELYGQLFMARGRYQDFEVLQNPDTFMPFNAFPRPNGFTLSNFQTNTVLRWEYRPGSTLFVVWSQGRNRDLEFDRLEDTVPHPGLGDQFSDTFGVFPDNVFLIKLNYTFLR
jgi:hypothetical protein